jgi:hypothetical protein
VALVLEAAIAEAVTQGVDPAERGARLALEVPGEIFLAPRSGVERVYPNVIYFNRADRGHFAAWEAGAFQSGAPRHLQDAYADRETGMAD